MELGDLAKTVLFLFLIGLVLATGILVVDKFGRVSRTTTSVTSTGLNLTAAGSNDFSQTYCIGFTSVSNSTTSFATTNLHYSNADGCVVSNDAIAGCGPEAAAYCNITYTYGATTDTATTMINWNTGLSAISSSWLPLIITVMVLAIVLGLVLSSFTAGRNN